MALVNVAALHFTTSVLFGSRFPTSIFLVLQTKTNFSMKPVVMRARHPAKTESAKTLNRRMQKKYNGTPEKPRLSVFCSDKQLYAMLVDDQNKKCLFYGSTLQKSIRKDPHCSTTEAAKRVGEELIKACNDLNIDEISSYDRNGFATGERINAFEIAISETKLSFELDGSHSGDYLIISNLCARAGRWYDVDYLRKLMKDRGVVKNPGVAS